MNWREKTWVQNQDPKCKTLKSQLEQGVGSGAAWEYFILGDRIICLCYVPVYPNQPLQNKTASSPGNDNVLVHLVYHLHHLGGRVPALSTEEITLSNFQFSYHPSSWRYCGQPLLFVSFSYFPLNNQGPSPSIVRE